MTPRRQPVKKIWHKTVYQPKRDKKAFAKQMRDSMSPPEAKIWGHIRRVDWQGLQWTRQRVTCGYILDFALSRLRLAFEIDGKQHGTAEAVAYDRHRDAVLKQAGWTVVRIHARDVFARPIVVLQYIQRCVAETLAKSRATPKTR